MNELIYLFLGLIICAPLLLAVFQAMSGLVNTYRFNLNVRDCYRMAIKSVLQDFVRKEDLQQFVFYCLEIIVATLILFMLSFYQSAYGLPEIIILLIALNLFSLLKSFLLRKSDESFVLDDSIVKLSCILFLAMIININLLVTYKTTDIASIVDAQEWFSYSEIFSLGIFLNPFNAILFVVLTILSVNCPVPRPKRYIYGQGGQVFVEQCILVLKLFVLSAVFVYLFLGGLPEIAFLQAFGTNSEFVIPLHIVFWFAKVLIVFSIFSFINSYLPYVNERMVGEAMILWFIPFGFISILYSCLWRGNFV